MEGGCSGSSFDERRCSLGGAVSSRVPGGFVPSQFAASSVVASLRRLLARPIDEIVLRSRPSEAGSGRGAPKVLFWMSGIAVAWKSDDDGR